MAAGKYFTSIIGFAGKAALVILLIESSAAAFWGTVEFFHEGWFAPYWKYLPLYMAPFLTIYILSIIAPVLPAVSGLTIVTGSSTVSILRILRLRQLHEPISPSAFAVWFLLALPGLLLITESLMRRRKVFHESGGSPGIHHERETPSGKKILTTGTGKGAPTHVRSGRKLLISVVVIPVLVVIASGAPLLRRNLQRVPLENYGEVEVEGGGVALVLAGSGPGWLYSNREPIRFRGKTYSGLSWNEIALFGKEPVGFEGKRYGPEYDGTEESIYYATREDFDRYNMFRYIDESGSELTDSLQDHWRLPRVEEYVAVLTRRGENCGGRFDPEKGEATYEMTPDKDAPIWAPEKEVIYYWTSTSMDERRAYQVSYSGRVTGVFKTTKQDYRGFRAVRTERRKAPASP